MRRPFIITICLLLSGGIALGQPASDELSLWPVSESRPLVARGPRSAPSKPRLAPVTEPAPFEPANHGAKPLQNASIRPEPLSKEIVDAAVAQTSFSPPPSVEVARLKPTALSPTSGRRFSTEPTATQVDALAQSSDELLAANDSKQAPPQPDSGSSAVEDRSDGSPSRRLLPPSRRGGSADSATSRPSPRFGDFGLDAETFTTAGAGLAIVIGLVLLLAWAYRRAAPRSARPLPDEVLTVLGRATLAGKQVTQLVKVGNKLLLVALTPEGPKTLTEVSDPTEVTRLLGLCEQSNSVGATAAFQEVFDQILREPAPPGFLGEESSLVDRHKLADAYANTPGGRAYG